MAQNNLTKLGSLVSSKKWMRLKEINLCRRINHNRELKAKFNHNNNNNNNNSNLNNSKSNN